MMSSVIAWLVLSLVCGTYGIECPDGWTTYQGSCYLHGQTAVSFSDAENFCKSKSADSTLVHINTDDENIFIINYLTAFQAHNHWIGLNDQLTEGTYVWTDGQTSDFLSWAKDQPDNHNNADCAFVSQHAGYQWNDAQCSAQMNPLCELRISA